MKINWKKHLLIWMIFALLTGNMTGVGISSVSAASNKKIRTVKITQAGKMLQKKL